MWFSNLNPMPNSQIMNSMIYFHNNMLIIIILTMTVITYLVTLMMFNKITNRMLKDNHMIEFIWTFIPILILFMVAFPSLKLLYLTDEMYNTSMSIKIIGHQWYWTYEYSDFKNINFDSYMLNLEKKNNLRLLDVDNQMVIPQSINIRLIISSSDVIHSWTIPSFGIKVDAIPGRLNQIKINSPRLGMFFGQCSEICGLNHSFMPISMEVIPLNLFFNWINKQMQ